MWDKWCLVQVSPEECEIYEHMKVLVLKGFVCVFMRNLKTIQQYKQIIPLDSIMRFILVSIMADPELILGTSPGWDAYLSSRQCDIVILGEDLVLGG